MKVISTLFVIFLVLAAIGGLFYGGYVAIGYLWNVYSELEVVTRVALLSSMAVVLLGSLIIAGAVKTVAETGTKGKLTEAKLILYISLVGLYEQYISGSQQPAQQTQTETITKLSELEAELLILASSAVIDVHGKLKAAVKNRGKSEKLAVLFQQFVKSIRRDLGHGPNYDESKLKFLVTSDPVISPERPGHDVSL